MSPTQGSGTTVLLVTINPQNLAAEAYPSSRSLKQEWVIMFQPFFRLQSGFGFRSEQDGRGSQPMPAQAGPGARASK